MKSIKKLVMGPRLRLTSVLLSLLLAACGTASRLLENAAADDSPTPPVPPA